MESSTYAAEAATEESHWWFVGRRRLFAREIRGLALPSDARILDVGTSTGTNLRLLRDMGFTNVQGLDFSEEAILHCRQKGLGDVRQGDICAMPFPDDSFDLVLATDIVEHVDDDQTALRELHRVVRQGGHVLLTVPAFAALWGLQDDVSHHKRRYRQAPFNGLVAQAGFAVRKTYYCNFILFAPIWLSRSLIRLFKIRVESENTINNPLLNAVFQRVFDLDLSLAPRLKVPFGVSILTLGGKAAARGREG